MREVSAVEAGRGVARPRAVKERRRPPSRQAIDPVVAAVFNVEVDDLRAPTRRSSPNEGDLVLDPFCGCGTTVHAAQKLNRNWIGIDVTHLAIALIERRLNEAFPLGSNTRFMACRLI